MSDRQYYYRVTECRATSAKEADCICWHDEGTGPLVGSTHEPKVWREKPSATPTWQQKIEFISYKLTEMTAPLSQNKSNLMDCPFCGAGARIWDKPQEFDDRRYMKLKVECCYCDTQQFAVMCYRDFKELTEAQIDAVLRPTVIERSCAREAGGRNAQSALLQVHASGAERTNECAVVL